MSYQEQVTNSFNFAMQNIVSKDATPNELAKWVPIPPNVLAHARKIDARRTWTSEGEAHDYNLSEITRVEDIEPLLSSAFRQHTQLVMREGFDIDGSNEQVLEWVYKRLFEIQVLTAKTTRMWIREAASNLIRFSNAYLVFVRDRELTNARPYKYMGALLEPVVGVFSPDPITFKAQRDHLGRILFYTQYMPESGLRKTFAPYNVLHLTYNKRSGFAYGVPWVMPVLDDIRSLRRLEEYTELLAASHTFPLYHYKVGTDKQPASVNPITGFSEIDEMTNKVESLPTEGCLVTDHRHEIKAVGAEGEALNLQPYLEYFQQRVRSGLGISDVQLGQGGTSNRNTAQALTKQAEDQAKDIQTVIADHLNARLMIEFLLDGGFKLSEDNAVTLSFNEINKEEERAKENHELNKFNNSATTHTEMRKKMRLDPLKEAEWDDTTGEHVERKALERQLATLKKYGADPGTMAKQKAQQSKASKTTSSKAKPSNQYGTKTTKPRVSKNSARFLMSIGEDLELTKHNIAVLNGTPVNGKFIKNLLSTHIDRTCRNTIDLLIPIFMSALIESDVEMTQSEAETLVKGLVESNLRNVLNRCKINISDEDRFENKTLIMSQLEALRPAVQESIDSILESCDSELKDETNGSQISRHLENRTEDLESQSDECLCGCVENEPEGAGTIPGTVKA